MIQRVVLIKLNEDLAHRRGRRAVTRHTVKTFQSIPGVLGVTVGEAGDDATAGSWDISLMVFLAGPESVEPYVNHPAHQEYVKAYLTPRITFKKAWNFEIPDGSLPHDPWAQLPSDR